MTAFDPVLLFLGVLGVAILWTIRHRVSARLSGRRLAAVAVGALAILMVISLSIRFTGPGLLIPSSRLLNWKLNAGAPGSSNAKLPTTTALTIEVEHPGCAPIDGSSWIADPMISSTPWSVTITMRMSDSPEVARCGSQQTPHEGSLPLVGGYLTGIFVPIHLSEPLGGRALFDGSSFPPVERSPH